MRMNEFEEAIKNEQKRIQRLVNSTGQFESLEKRGALIAEPRRNGIYCYERTGQSKKYLGRPDAEAARNCLQYHYLAEKRKRLLADDNLLKKVEEQYLAYDYESVMAALSDSCRKIANEDFNDA